MKRKKIKQPRAKHICVFLSSSDWVDRAYFKTASEMGRRIAERGYVLVYGGGNVGLMGELACSAARAGGKIVAIIPKAMHVKTPVLEYQHELVATVDMRERKTLMELRSDAFVALPGGFGTLEELLEILTLKQLGYHNKPVVILNARGFYNGLLRFFEHFYRNKFASPKHRNLYQVAKTPDEVFNYLDSCA